MLAIIYGFFGCMDIILGIGCLEFICRRTESILLDDSGILAEVAYYIGYMVERLYHGPGFEIEYMD